MTDPSTDPRWTHLMQTPHAAEADFVVNLLNAHGIAAFHRRSAGFDVPDFLATGARDILVPEAELENARDVVHPSEDPDTTP